MASIFELIKVGEGADEFWDAFGDDKGITLILLRDFFGCFVLSLPKRDISLASTAFA